ncbi:STAS domain-containing protein [Aneurinibacillus aneurinilyticus]|jgi:anti-anti-sigma factor|nr:STAS domain-containing protein [Aneurinibacillus aneurinilyticus]MCI1692589.1 STAS domain-containing protein [Aneurinibacillus aneurinilyticus]MED0670190.1 STAS domain-containing protein [Aneurinibacillus aneurinilyticus]MED0705151.1 STAS domain-containing protein [Aneurinibacillus aneurinilyticus]MED0725647.1 STAS domain-containing protein [Aneurinibacillus aneurinilyticus]MED0733851.1 STAS domain-containing protein [Aneurinibacillus aneurinilyticus]
MINYNVDHEQITFTFKEDINFETVRQIETKVRELEIPGQPKRIVIDFKQVRFIDSTGVGFLISWIHPLISDYQIRIINSSFPVKNILQICKLDTLVDIT